MGKGSSVAERDLCKIWAALERIAGASEGQPHPGSVRHKEQLAAFGKRYAVQALLNLTQNLTQPPGLYCATGEQAPQLSDVPISEPVLQGHGKSARPVWHRCEHGMLRKLGPDKLAFKLREPVRLSV